MLTGSSNDETEHRFFFVRAYDYRSLNGVIVLLFMVFFAAVSGFVSFESFRMGPVDCTQPFLAIGFAISAIFCATIGAKFAWEMIVNGINVLVVDEDGIEYGGKSWAWDEIARVGCVGQPMKVDLFFIILGDLSQQRQVYPVTPPMREHEYDELAQSLKDFLSQEHPHVVVDKVPTPYES